MLCVSISACTSGQDEAVAQARRLEEAAGSAPPSGDPAVIAAVKAERETSSKVYAQCLMRAARSLDDRKSDPGTIAEAMLSACSAEWQQNVKVHCRGMSLDCQRAAREHEMVGAAIKIVLENRKAAQSRPTPQ
jgi:hypothetical protein